MVDVLIFQKLVVFEKGILDKQCMPSSDCFWRSSLIWAFPVCYSDKHFVNSIPDNSHFYLEEKEIILEHLPYIHISEMQSDIFRWLQQCPSQRDLWVHSCILLFQRCSLIFCGDFNSAPHRGIYEFMTKKEIREDHIAWKEGMHGWMFAGFHSRSWAWSWYQKMWTWYSFYQFTELIHSSN